MPHAVEGYPECVVEYPFWVGDSACDGEPYNTEACGWDGGDCCPCGCVGVCSDHSWSYSDDSYYDSGYGCKDPSLEECDKSVEGEKHGGSAKNTDGHVHDTQWAFPEDPARTGGKVLVQMFFLKVEGIL
ncbi:unnamed protein product [Ectocarpus sp. 8 AP-2014]